MLNAILKIMKELVYSGNGNGVSGKFRNHVFYLQSEHKIPQPNHRTALVIFSEKSEALTEFE